jgi:predicted GNAT family acetyltransferase
MGASLGEMQELYDLRVRREPTYPGALVERTAQTVRLVESGRGWVSWSDLGGLSPSEVDSAIEAEIARFSQLGVLGNLEWKLYGRDRPDDLRERLAAQGFVPKDPADAILVLDLAELPPDLRSTRGHDVRRVQGSEGLDDIINIMLKVWPDEDAADYRRFVEESIAADPAGTSLWLAYVEGRPVAEGRIEFACKEFAGLWGGATLPGYRQRGLYTALVAARAAEALARGCKYLTIDASPMSRAVLEKRGFRLLDTALECNYVASRGLPPTAEAKPASGRA